MNSKPFDPSHLITTTVGNIAMQLMTGNTYELDDPIFRQVMKHTMRIFEIIGPAGLLSTVQLLRAIPSPGKRQFGGSIRWDSSELFDETNLLGSCIEILLGGLETTSTVVVWIVHTLASYPEAQRRVRQEILQVIGKDRLPRFSDHNRMPLTMAIIAECMRLRPAGPFHIAHIALEDLKVGAYDIPKGSPITLNIWHLAQSPTLWEKPKSFRPERFLTDDGKFDRKHEPFLFGIGRRSCPGESLARVEIFLFTTFILQRFNIRLAEGVPVDIGTRASATVSPDPYQIHAVKAT
ncbi:cytochrome P450 2D26-like [Lytechinus pictus]|uniref:cytochrome P450 2D26-like n=1 Tax=Lytechinus pictus TaxID=7653 RepID=UPI0030B9F145